MLRPFFSLIVECHLAGTIHTY